MDLPILFKKTYKQFGPKNGGLGTHQEPHVPHIESEEMAWQNVFQTFDTKPPMGFFNNPRILTLTILLMVFSKSGVHQLIIGTLRFERIHIPSQR